MSTVEAPNVDVTQCECCSGTGIISRPDTNGDNEALGDCPRCHGSGYIKSNPQVIMYETDYLYRRLIQTPDDNTLRLMYADALDELPSDVNPYLREHECDKCKDGTIVRLKSTMFGVSSVIGPVKVAPGHQVEVGQLLISNKNGYAVPYDYKVHPGIDKQANAWVMPTATAHTGHLTSLVIGTALQCEKCKGSGKTYTGYDKNVKAKFIRVQCRLYDIVHMYANINVSSTKVKIGEEHSIEYAGLMMQQKLLAHQLGHHVIRNGLIVNEQVNEGLYIERGFPSRVECTTQWWFDNGDKYVAKHPITDVVINDLGSFIPRNENVYNMTVDTWGKKECMMEIANSRFAGGSMGADVRDLRIIQALSKQWPTVTRWRIV